MQHLIKVCLLERYLCIDDEVLIHELGHSYMAIYVGGTVSKILLWPFGGLAYCGFHRDYKRQLAVSLAGPIVHIPLFLMFYGIW